MHLPTVQLDEDLVAYIQVQNDAVTGIVVVLVRVLSNGAGPNLVRKENDLLTPCAELGWRDRVKWLLLDVARPHKGSGLRC
jgi:hypothetical protein